MDQSGDSWDGVGNLGGLTLEPVCTGPAWGLANQEDWRRPWRLPCCGSGEGIPGTLQC